MSGSNCSSPELPPGFRFHPTDEELIMHYLRNQALSRPCPASVIPELNIYKFDPWELPGKSQFAEGEWYFFTPRDRKYPNGARPNRATASGYWKATGTDKAIHSNSHYVGVKKALVFYKGRPPKGRKTGWIMHEYRLAASLAGTAARPKGSMRLDDWVLCRIYQRKSPKRMTDDDTDEDLSISLSLSPEDYLCDQAMTPTEEGAHGGEESVNDVGAAAAAAAVVEEGDPQPQPQPLAFPRSFSLAHLLEAEYMSVSEMLNEYTSGPGDDFHAIASSFEIERDDAADPAPFPTDHDDKLSGSIKSASVPLFDISNFLDHTIF